MSTAIAILRGEEVRLEKELQDVRAGIAQLEGNVRLQLTPTHKKQPTNGTPRKSGDYKQPYQVLKDARNSALAAEAPTVRPGQYRGMKMSAALQAYLLERPGSQPLPKVLLDLAAAGTKTVSKYANDLNGQARKYLTITIQNNKSIFGFDKEGDLVWLPDREPNAK